MWRTAVERVGAWLSLIERGGVWCSMVKCCGRYVKCGGSYCTFISNANSNNTHSNFTKKNEANELLFVFLSSLHSISYTIIKWYKL